MTPHFVVLFPKQFDLAQLVDFNQHGTQAVVHVMAVVCNLIGQICGLGFQRRLVTTQKAFTDFAQLSGFLGRTVLEDPLAGFEGQIQARELRVLLLQQIDYAQ